MSDRSDSLLTPKPHAKKQRLDLLLVERGLAESREQARRLIMAGEVLVNDEVNDKPGKSVPLVASLRVRNPLPYVSRGGLKLAAALDEFQLDVTDLTAVDVGASTGGFTDCQLQRNVARVYAVDVGYGQLAWKLRTDARVVAIERTNIRYLEQLPEGVLADLAVIDASFISLALVLPATLRLLTPHAQIVALIKPQFEAGKAQVGKGGVVRDKAVHRRVLEEVLHLAGELGLLIAGLTVSPAPGPAGNIEFLVWLQRIGAGDMEGVVNPSIDLERALLKALDQAAQLKVRHKHPDVEPPDQKVGAL
ncbi:MAG: TlyA family RNA methyltransferase [Chloroflexi bacterium]|nr:TlyA family RNA methyltransferase [Chloroflexota bacterium]